ncbi:unnamed protein product [Mytilus coruscus]|uniref:Reverse transcriptase domain-containing protein n=1 Tax=Mytilus coruscus TaxID=42192 RepID=A0A6J8DRZ0_MYTCO|nr:unnamed protein product [Mytilus coruscus]
MDYYGITAENFIHASEILLEYLQLLINTSFEHCYIPNLLKIGTLFPVFKNKGDIKNATNYRGITVTPTYSKIIEIIIKGRENNKILKHQNPLQKGFTAKSTPLICELFIEEFERENKDLKLPTYVALLDGKSAFDVVVHKNLIRRLFQIGFSQQSILMTSNLYENATSCVKWGNTLSNCLFNIEQGVRQGEAISADLYKVYINPLLQILSTSGLGAKIGNINCCAPTCADDVALISNNPFELQNMINIAVDFSQREGYLLQPQKSVVLPIKTCNKMLDIDQGFWKLKNIDMPIVQDSSHIGIKKSQKDSTNATITENRRSITYILPVLTYGLEVLIPSGKNLDLIQQQHKRWIKQILSLKLNVADPAIYLLSGLLPLEAEIHIKIITLFGNITRAERSSLEWRIAERQLQIKTYSSNSWFIDLKKICGKYDIVELEQYLEKPLTKIKWKKFTTKKIHKYWEGAIKTKMKGYSTLRYLKCEYDIGRIHHLLKTTSANITEIKKLSICSKLVTGTYILQSNKAEYSNYATNPMCRLCNKADETIEHFILLCETTSQIRTSLIGKILHEGSLVLARESLQTPIDLITFIINPYYYLSKKMCKDVEDRVGNHLVPLCRQLLYTLHSKRYDVLTKIDTKANRK